MVVKRTIDITSSVIGLVLLAIPFALIAIIIKLDSKGPAFFRQERAGKNSKPFIIWKFRTMVDGAIDIGLGISTAQDDMRITSVGRFLRVLSLDELPQLINVLRGEMSLVGPRPTFMYQVELYTPEQLHRMDMKPGVTSWAAINGRNAITWEERIHLDLWYIHHKSLALDLRILVKTLWVAFVSRDGVYDARGANDDFTQVVPEKHR